MKWRADDLDAVTARDCGEMVNRLRCWRSAQGRQCFRFGKPSHCSHEILKLVVRRHSQPPANLRLDAIRMRRAFDRQNDVAGSRGTVLLADFH